MDCTRQLLFLLLPLTPLLLLLTPTTYPIAKCPRNNPIDSLFVIFFVIFLLLKFDKISFDTSLALIFTWQWTTQSIAMHSGLFLFAEVAIVHARVHVVPLRVLCICSIMGINHPIACIYTMSFIISIVIHKFESYINLMAITWVIGLMTLLWINCFSIVGFVNSIGFGLLASKFMKNQRIKVIPVTIAACMVWIPVLGWMQAVVATAIVLVFVVWANTKEIKQEEQNILITALFAREVIMPVAPGVWFFGKLINGESQALMAMMCVFAIVFAMNKHVFSQASGTAFHYDVKLLAAIVFWKAYVQIMSQEFPIATKDTAAVIMVILSIFAALGFSIWIVAPFVKQSKNWIRAIGWILIAGLVSSLWVAIPLLAHSPMLAQTTKDDTWYGKSITHQKQWCGQRCLSPQTYWISLQDRPTLPNMTKDDLHAFQTQEPVFCQTSFATPIEEWRHKTIWVLGDSVARFMFYGVANEIVDKNYGFPSSAYHGNIQASKQLTFSWAPYVTNVTVLILEAIAGLDDASIDKVLVVSCGLWDKLWKRDVELYHRELLELRNAIPNSWTIVFVEMTFVQENNLYGEHKQMYLKEDGNVIWRSKVLQSGFDDNLPNTYYLPTVNATLMRYSKDGVHYDAHTYQALARTMLRGVGLMQGW